mmetsp:Transcript_94896/g.305445  ORF Transcript_94896/g.305445 Transcript_94896/m.305445 type:complete len:239 (+) Transcript_94896:672-1388(+)
MVPYEKAERRFGDVMCVFLRDSAMKRPILQHVVMFVDQDVVFEKAGSGDANPFRLTDLATVEKEWKPVKHGGLFSWELRRPHFDTEQGWTFAERFSMLSQELDERWPQFWQWPRKVQQWHSVGRGDNPREPPEIVSLSILKARRYVFERRADGKWRPQRADLALRQLLLQHRLPAVAIVPGFWDIECQGQRCSIGFVSSALLVLLCGAQLVPLTNRFGRREPVHRGRRSRVVFNVVSV